MYRSGYRSRNFGPQNESGTTNEVNDPLSRNRRITNTNWNSILKEISEIDISRRSPPASSSGIASADDPSALDSPSSRDGATCRYETRDDRTVTSQSRDDRATTSQSHGDMVSSLYISPTAKANRLVENMAKHYNGNFHRPPPRDNIRYPYETESKAVDRIDSIHQRDSGEYFTDMKQQGPNRVLYRSAASNPTNGDSNGQLCNCSLARVESNNSSMLQQSYYADEIRMLAESSRNYGEIRGGAKRPQQLDNSACEGCKSHNSSFSCNQSQHDTSFADKRRLFNNYQDTNYQQGQQRRTPISHGEIGPNQVSNNQIISGRTPISQGEIVSNQLPNNQVFNEKNPQDPRNNPKLLASYRESPASMFSESSHVYRSYPDTGRFPPSSFSSCNSNSTNYRPPSSAAQEIIYHPPLSTSCSDTAGKLPQGVFNTKYLGTEMIPEISRPNLCSNAIRQSPRRECSRRYRKNFEHSEGRYHDFRSNPESKPYYDGKPNYGSRSNQDIRPNHTDNLPNKDDILKRLRPSSRLSMDEHIRITNHRVPEKHENLRKTASNGLHLTESTKIATSSNSVDPNRTFRKQLLHDNHFGAENIVKFIDPNLTCNKDTGDSSISESNNSTPDREYEGINQLPDYIIHKILTSGLDSYDLCRTARVCKRFYRLVWSPTLWKSITINSSQVDADAAILSLTTILSEHTPTVCLGVEMINLNGCSRLTDRGLYLIAQRCIDLRHLEISGCDMVTNIAVFEVVSRCVSLAHLNLSGCSQVTCISLTPEANIQATTYGKQVVLGHLDMTDCIHLDDSGVQLIVSYCSHLTHVYLRRCSRVGDLGVQYLATYCTGLRELSISDCAKVTDRGVSELARLGSTLRYLSVAKCEAITDIGIRRMAECCTRLRYLNTRGCTLITDSSIICLANSTRTKLRSLDIGKCGVTDRALRVLAVRCATLRKLGLRGCDGISDQGLLEVARSCRALRQLNIQDCSTVSLQAFREIRRVCRNCVIEHTNPSYC